jgi:hypothetical protein
MPIANFRQSVAVTLIRHYRACFAAYWTLTAALALLLLSPQAAQSPAPQAPGQRAVCTDGRVLVQFYIEKASRCILIVQATH